MLELLDHLIIASTNNFITLFSALLAILIGTPFLSQKGGIPRVFKKFVSKPQFLLIVVVVGLILLFIIYPIISSILTNFIINFTEFTIPVLILLSGMVIFVWDKTMVWNFRLYWFILLIIGVLLTVLEYFF
jgi:hypothetical protein